MDNTSDTILIDKIRISGFRGIKNLEMSLPRITVLIGTNNSGKTSIIKSLQLALGDYARYLSEEDFFIDPDKKRAAEIVIDIRIVPQNSEGDRVQAFNEEWAAEFGDKIKFEVNGYQFVAIRTRAEADKKKGGFDVSRSTLETWPDLSDWRTAKNKETPIPNRLLNMPFISVEAQRDVYQELRDKSSFIGRILSHIEYDETEIGALEELIGEVNQQAINKSQVLKEFKANLEKLKQPFQDTGNVEITPFPKKLRDLSKHFSIYFGEDKNRVFSMEYHGMGTRSWASIITLMSFVDLLAVEYEKEADPFFPILAAEEPEAHLHPNAQKTLYNQLSKSKGQVIVSTHSPYFSAMANHLELRYLNKKTDGLIEARYIDDQLKEEDLRRLKREIIHSRGEILFAKALILTEGETEEQALPPLFKRYFRSDAFDLGVNFIGVGGSGKKYLPFLTFAKDFDIPLFIFSDGERDAVKGLKKHYEVVFGEIDITNNPFITILDNTDFENYLISSGFKGLIEAAIKSIDGDDAIEEWIKKRDGTLSSRTKTNKPPCTCCKQPIYEDVIRDYKNTGGYDKALNDIIDSGKPKYAAAIATELCKLEPNKFPQKVIEFFEKVKSEMKI